MKQILIVFMLVAAFSACKDNDPKPKNTYEGQAEYLRFTYNGTDRINCYNIDDMIDTFNQSVLGDAPIFKGYPAAHFEISNTDHPSLNHLGMSLIFHTDQQFDQIKDSCSLVIDNYGDYYHGVFEGYLRAQDDPNNIIHITAGEFLVIAP
jgi:hypothetical protein